MNDGVFLCSPFFFFPGRLFALLITNYVLQFKLDYVYSADGERGPEVHHPAYNEMTLPDSGLWPEGNYDERWGILMFLVCFFKFFLSFCSTNYDLRFKLDYVYLADVKW
jgi:hypothetical protein